LSIHWGSPEDTPVALDHDGDGKADLAVIRNGRFEILLSSANYLKSVQVQ
jgi:membrane-bound lytic murein transglycosylase B